MMPDPPFRAAPRSQPSGCIERMPCRASSPGTASCITATRRTMRERICARSEIGSGASAGSRPAPASFFRHVGRNPVSLLIPCHRAVGSTGKLTGFAGGLDRKRFLLDHERTHAQSA